MVCNKILWQYENVVNNNYKILGQNLVKKKEKAEKSLQRNNFSAFGIKLDYSHSPDGNEF